MEGQPGSDPDTPASARVYDYLAGGQDNNPADRDLADEISGLCPGIPRMARASRLFAGQMVKLAAAAGIGRFLDLGCGYPPAPGTAVHDMARSVRPGARVAYTDLDEDVAGLCTWEYLTEGRLTGISVARADLRDPAAVLADPAVRRVIVPGEPACVIAAMVVYNMPPEQGAAVTAGYMRMLAPGSWLIATAGRNDDAERWAQVRAEWRERTGTRIWNYTPAEFTALFAGLEAVEPPGPVGPHGLVYALGGAGRMPLP